MSPTKFQQLRSLLERVAEQKPVGFPRTESSTEQLSHREWQVPSEAHVEELQ